jgi:hypothetical protein
MSGVEWYVDSDALRYMTYDRKTFSKFQEQEEGMRVELVDDATCPLKGCGSNSCQISSSDVLELNVVSFIPTLKKNLLVVSYMINFQCRVTFEGRQCTISNCILSSLKTLGRGVQNGGLYRLLADLMALVHDSEMLCKPSNFEENGRMP